MFRKRSVTAMFSQTPNDGLNASPPSFMLSKAQSKKKIKGAIKVKEIKFCEGCGFEYEGACPEHGSMMLVGNQKVKKKKPYSAGDTIPTFLSLGRSGIRNAGLGVWTERELPKGIVFGPFRGKITRDSKEAEESGYAWEILKGGKVHHYVDASDEKASNWLRYVNCAVQEDRRNLEAFQHKKQIYYRTCKTIPPHTELLIWYGDSYARDLGIEIKENTEPTIRGEVEGEECDVCGSLFATENAMKRHRKTHPRSDGKGKHKCHLCSYSASLKNDLVRHVRTHTGERPYLCEHCGAAFTRKNHLRRHLLIHSGPKPFTCGSCGKNFTKSENLRRHEKIHSGERSFLCPTCGKGFIQKGQLIYHERIHSGQKPYKCNDCDYRFAHSRDLQRHIIRNHTKNYPHLCSKCGKGFTVPSRLRKHMEKDHADVRMEENA